MVESSRLVFKLLCERLKSSNFDFKMDTTTQFNLHHNRQLNVNARNVLKINPFWLCEIAWFLLQPII